jgi:hypothetical protein
MKYKYSFFFLLAVSYSMIISCKDFLDVVPQSNQIAATLIYDNDDSTKNVFRGVYAKMHDDLYVSTYAIALSTSLSGDELDYPSDQLLLDIYTNKIDPSTNIYTNGFWENAYKLIYTANDAYERCSTSTKLSAEVKKQAMAEAQFVRAYWFFYLTSLYGDIPMPVTTAEQLDPQLFPTAPDKVYEQIVSDLKNAQHDLDEFYTLSENDDPTIRSERLWPGSAAATALLARVYLYQRQFPEAEAMASLLINNSSVYSLEPNLNQVFLKTSHEVIWQVGNINKNYSMTNTLEGNKFELTNPPLMSGKQAISTTLLAAFEEGDLRKKYWTNVYSDNSVSPAVDYYYPYKYKVSSGQEQKEHAVIFRLAEQYLIRAEARIQLGQLAAGIADVNIIRARAGLSPIAVDGPSQDALLAIVFKERQRELFTEQGHRWLDLKRTGAIDIIMNAVCPLKGTNWTPQKRLWPLPAQELLKAPNLRQNDGY